MPDHSPVASVDLVDVSANFLINRIKFSKAGYGRDDDSIAEFASKVAERKQQPIYLALAQAIHEMLWTSTEHSFDEEHHTASLMGHFSTNLSWYVLSEFNSRLLRGEQTDTLSGLYQIKWATQSKPSEARTGGDFAIAVPTKSGTFQVTLLQAKRAHESGSGSAEVDIYRFRNKKIDAATDTRRIMEADRRLLHVMKHFDSFETALPKWDDKDATHQLETLLRADRLAKEYAALTNNALAMMGNLSNYVVWNLRRTVRNIDYYPPVPTVMTAKEVAKTLLTKWKKEKVVADNELEATATLDEPHFRIPTLGSDFTEIMYSAYKNPLNRGIIISMDWAEEFIGDFSEMCPGIDFLLLSDSDEGSEEGLKLESALKNASYHIMTRMDRAALKALAIQKAKDDQLPSTEPSARTLSPKTSRGHGR